MHYIAEQFCVSTCCNAFHEQFAGRLQHKIFLCFLNSIRENQK